MNYIILGIQIFITFFLIFLSYKLGKKDGLYLAIALFSSIICIMLFKMINVLDFDINMGIPFIVGILILNNIIVHRYGFDELKRIMYTFGISYILTYIVIMVTTMIVSSNYNLISNNNYDILFGYDLYNIRYFVGGLLSIGMIIWMGSNVYDSIRKNKNSVIFNNIGSILVVLFVESIIFVTISHVGNYTLVELFGMVVNRYLIEVVIGILGLIPIYLLVRRKEK